MSDLTNFGGSGVYPVVLRGFSRLFTQESFLAALWRPHGMPELKPWLAMCKASALSSVLLLWLPLTTF